MFSATQPKKNEEAIVSLFTAVCGRHHGPIVVWAITDFLLFSCSKGVVAHRCRGRGQNISIKGQMVGKKA